MKIAFVLAALCGMLLAATAMTFDDDGMDGLQDPTSVAWRGCRGCSWRESDLDEPVTADEIEDMLHMLDAQDRGRRRGDRRDRRDRRDRGRRDRGRGDRRGGPDIDDDILDEPATIGGEMAQDPLLGWGWGGWGRPWGGWAGWGRPWGGWGGWGRGWGWGGRGWGRRYYDSDGSQEMQGEEPETTADDLEDIMTLDSQGGRDRGYRRDRYRGDRWCYRGDCDRYRGDRDRYRGDRDRYRGRRNDVEL